MKHVLTIAPLQALTLALSIVTSQFAQAGMILVPEEKADQIIEAVKDAMRSEKTFICNDGKQWPVIGDQVAEHIEDQISMGTLVGQSDDGQPILLLYFRDDLYLKHYMYISSDRSNTKIVKFEEFRFEGKSVNVGTLTEPRYEVQFQGESVVCRPKRGPVKQ